MRIAPPAMAQGAPPAGPAPTAPPPAPQPAEAAAPAAQGAPGYPPPGYAAPAYGPSLSSAPPPEQVRVESLQAGPPAGQAGQAGQVGSLPPPSAETKAPRHGFQMAFRTGASFPLGSATGASGDKLSRRYAWQFPLAADLGVKVSDAVFLGGYLGVGFGAEGSDTRIERYCDDDDDNFRNDITCSAFSFQIGIQAQYSFDPGARWNPWVGYGVGFEAAEQTIHDDNRSYRETSSVTGFTAAKVMFGADYRAGVGIGPFVEAAIGRYTRSRTEVNDEETHEGSIGNGAFHTWLTIGVRMVVNP